jgi:uracil-DNA glycosylase
MTDASLSRLASRVIVCRKCPRLVRYREAVAQAKRPAFRDWEYWGRPVPGFGDPRARMLIVGLAPAAHGGNRTGRVFTGDRSGDWLYRALHRAGFANRAVSVSRDDGLALRDCYIAAAVRCAPPANKPSPAEFARCRTYLEEEIRLLHDVRVVVALGGAALKAFLGAWMATGHEVPIPRPRLRHAAMWRLPPIVLIASYHPSQRNTQTGLLTESAFDAVFRSVRRLLEEDHAGAFDGGSEINLKQG